MEKLKCDTLFTTFEQQVECLASKSDEELLKMEATLVLPLPNAVLSAIMSYQPFIDGDVVVDQPVARYARGTFMNSPIYLSDTSMEAIIFLDTAYFPLDSGIIKIALRYIFDYSGEGDVISKIYGKVPASYWEKDGLEAGDEWAARILTDYLFICPNDWIAAKVHAAGIPAYRSTFQHVGSWASWYLGAPKKGWGCNKQANGTEENCCAQVGTTNVCHAFDLVTIFDTMFALPPSMHFPTRTAAEKDLSVFMQKEVFGSFAHNQTLPWPQFDNVTRPAFNFSIPVRGTVHQYRGQFCRAFDKYGYNRN